MNIFYEWSLHSCDVSQKPKNQLNTVLVWGCHVAAQTNLVKKLANCPTLHRMSAANTVAHNMLFDEGSKKWKLTYVGFLSKECSKTCNNSPTKTPVLWSQRLSLRKVSPRLSPLWVYINKCLPRLIAQEFIATYDIRFHFIQKIIGKFLLLRKQNNA